VLDAYQAEIIALTEQAERRQRLREQGQQLRARVHEIEQQRRDRAAELRLLEGVDAFCTSIRDAMVAPSFEGTQKVLQLVVQRIVVGRITASPLSMSCRAGRFDCNRNII